MYETLTKYGYKNRKDLINEYERRLHSVASMQTSLTIKPFSQQKGQRLPQQYPLFYITTPDLVRMIEEILNNSKVLELQVKILPDSMIDYVKRTQLINEIKSTNDIEGVKSTRKEIDDAITAQDTDLEIRFKQTVSMYLKSLNSEKLSINNLQDFRHIYDEVVAEEVSDNDQPDGLLFRKESVEITDQKSNKIVHRGASTEKAIQEDLLKLIAFMNEKNHAYLIKAIVTHYFFEYIHPFYDGNGRMGRFILTSYLMNKLDEFSALSISEAIFTYRKKYEDAFIETSSPNNYGDLTPFIISMLEIILAGQESMLKEIEQIHYRMESIIHYIESSNYTDEQKTVLFVLLQVHLFDIPNKKIENKELHQVLKQKLSRQKVDKVLKELEEASLVKKVKSRPITYVLNEDALMDFG